MTTRAVFLPLLLWGLLLAGCQTPLMPDEVAGLFWEAIQKGDHRTLQRLVAPGTMDTQEADGEVLPVSAVKLGATVIEGDQARVATEVTLSGDHPVTVPLETRLVRIDRRWLVDYRATVQSLRSDSPVAQALFTLQTLTERLQRGLEESTRELQRQAPEIERQLDELGRELESKVPEIQRQLEEFARQLQEALEGLQKPPPSRSPRTPDGHPI
ncbi:MAG: OmpH family outer membrane protein [Gammaproteobacteria bacterium]|nr:MAG: OmpH family outer membrane protein [Gammaproteobacteria bacterium]